jgi:radical SAM protein with 4Fe4S-binding SPASM domain
MTSSRSTSSPYDGDPRKLARWRSDPAEPPSIAVWELTLRCDLGCRHCGSRAGRAREKELSTAQALDVVEQLADLGLKEVTLIGGEFYLREDWREIAAAISANHMLCSIVTGARQLTDERIAQAAAAGVGKISLSIDGLENTHDALRGSRGSWLAAVSAARRISANGLDLSVNTQCNRLSMPELPAVADVLSDIGARSWMPILTGPMGRAADCPSLMLQPYHLLYLFPLLAAIKRDKLDPNGIALFPGNNIGYFGPLAETLRYGSDRGHTWGGCGAGVSSIGIEADGSLKGCPSLPSAPYVKGNVIEDGVESVWRRLRAEREAQPTQLWGFCATCPYAERCKAGCTWTSHVLFGRPGNMPFCHSRALAFAERGMVEKLERVGSAPGVPFDYGAFNIIEDDIGPTLASDDLIGMTLGSHLLGLNKDAKGVWKADELAKALGS